MRADIDLERGIVRFRHIRLDRRRPVREEGKSKASRRSVHRLPYVIDSLRRHIEAQDARRLRADSWAS